MFFLSHFVIEGHSMEPAIVAGNTVIASNIPYLFLKPKVGDIIAFKKKDNRKIFIKRIIKIDRSADREKYFVKGDNKNDSMDSRKFGWIDKQQIIGKIIARI